jgi:hypothetical protein
MAVIATAVAATVAAVASVGQAYAANKAAGQQQKMANIQNARERVQALRAMRVRQRSLEAQGVASGTAGGSAVTGAMGAAASSTAGAIGYQGALLANAQQITNWNNMATGFGALASVGSAISQYPSMFSGGSKAPTSVPKPTAATINTGSNFAPYT